nr:MAG TPA: minor capsid protein [Caudoviricetes sp.]
MFTPTEIEALPSAMEQLYRSLQLNIMSDLTERLKANGEEITSAADWQINRLYELGVSKDEIDSLIQSTLDVSDDEIDRIYDEVVKSGYARNEKLYTSKGKEYIPYAENKQLQQLVKAVKNQTKSEFKNITGSLGFAVRNPDNTVSFTPLAKFYQDTLDNGLMQIASGAVDYNTVLKKAVKAITDSGLRTVDYASGWSNRVDVAARRALMTGFNQVVAKVNEDNAEQLGTEYFEISYHRGARPTHQVWQGRVYSKKELETVCGLGTVTGLCGANCYHSYSPFIKGIDTPTYSEEELDRMNEEENTPKEYNGKTYTAYEAQQRQRQLETAMRADRQKIELLTQGGADDDTITGAKAKYFQRQDEYVKFSKAMNLPQQWERITVDGKNALGSKLPKKAESVNKITAENVAKSGKSGIIKEKSKKPITPITDKAISCIPKVDIEGYTEEQCLEIQKQHKELLKFSKEQNDNKEVAFVLKNDVSKMITEPIKGTDEKIDFGSALQGKDLFVMHNHPRNSSYSLNDIIEFIKNDSIKTFTIVKNDGNIEVLTKLKGYDRLSLLTELQRMEKKRIKTGSDSEYRKVIDKFLSKHQEGGLFEWKK